MKTAKEEAIELVEKYVNQPINFPYMDSVDDQCIGSGYMTYRSAKQCALIAVDETIKALNVLLNSGLNNDFDILKLRGEYMELKSEIEKL
jgi:methylase of polypeptide subunit release factors